MRARTALLLALAFFPAAPAQGATIEAVPGTPEAVSGDGSVVVAWYPTPTLPFEAFRWTAGTGMLGLGGLPGKDWSTARGVSADGSLTAS